MIECKERYTTESSELVLANDKAITDVATIEENLKKAAEEQKLQLNIDLGEANKRKNDSSEALKEAISKFQNEMSGIYVHLKFDGLNIQPTNYETITCTPTLAWLKRVPFAAIRSENQNYPHLDQLKQWFDLKTAISVEDFTAAIGNGDFDVFDHHCTINTTKLDELLGIVLAQKSEFEHDVIPLLKSCFKTGEYTPSLSGSLSQLVYETVNIGSVQASKSFGSVPQADLLDGYIIQLTSKISKSDVKYEVMNTQSH